MLRDSGHTSTGAPARRPRKSYPVNAKVVQVPRGTMPTSDRMAMFLSELLHRTSITKEGKGGHFVDMPSALLKQIAGSDYPSIIRECEKLGYIKINHRYSTLHHFCKSYRLEACYRTGETEECRLKRARLDANDRIRIEPNDETGIRLVECLREAVVPDDVAGDAWANYSVRAIHRGDVYATRCRYRRFHTTFTSLPKHIRRQIKLNGQEVVESDVTNAQALCLGLLAEEETSGRRGQRHGRPEGHHMFPFAQRRGSADESVRRFIECCEDGQLYEVLLAKAIAKGYRFHDFIFDPRERHKKDKKSGRAILNRDLCRDDAKGQFITMIFAEVWRTKRMPVFPIFAEEFPAMAEYVLKAKSEDYTGLSKSIAYKELAKNCQHLESSVMIDTVSRDLSRRFNIVTIHDSIQSPANNAPEVKAEIKQRWGEMGVSVAVKTS